MSHPLPDLSPADALLRLRGAGLPHLALLESAGPVTAYGRYSFLSAAPDHIQTEIPERPGGDAFFPAYLGGLHYEAAAQFGLSTHPPTPGASWWGHYPSGLVWDRQAGTLTVVGQPHLDWAALLAADPAAPRPLTLGPLSADDLDYRAGVRTIQELIRAGEVYQVNLSRGVSAPAQGDPLEAYLRLRAENPSPFMAYLETEGSVVVSVSPERLVDWQPGPDGLNISARPIAGTRRRGDTPAEDAALEAELRADPKERAEHTMLVDLVRHDLGRVAASGSVRVPDLMLVERYSHVMHLVSEVAAQAQGGLSVRDLLAATFPGGTITGAPKERVMEAIADLEPHPRRWYTGSVGRVSGQGADFNILIRTADFQRSGDGWRVTVRAGGGTVIDSDPDNEGEETVHKAQALLGVLAGLPGRRAQPPAPPVSGRDWRPPPPPTAPPLRVLLLDNRDSFTMNLAHDLLALGAQVEVRSQDEDAAALLATRPDAVMIGPGPGTPQTSGCTLELTRRSLQGGVPLLGVCLGHQALGEVLGGAVVRGQPVHGRPEAMQHSGAGLWAGIPQGAEFGRYHSLVVEGLDERLVSARSAAGVVQALDVQAVTGRPAWAVQFHPESVLSPWGRVLLGNWLRLAQAGGQGG
ncbi:chorismate-binding protein [Deinococcus radiophilus]|uniref:Aminodeoxychorismate components I/II n=1 Tax=Deinococcus radiophilus TaxID=32062 RepID=A0A431VWD0_9DEIO|nr:chorismate-binding protein [Deinococcus radiophilus]RTR27506.1 aminodeoxychorismate components I/II [Deinococcus radiophilus]UFA50372.1 chorismate-binding protein [Deinococcus radiophilus]